MDERREAGWPVPQGRWAVARDDPGKILVPGRQRADRPFERRLIERRDQATVPPAPNPADGSGSNGRPSAPRSQARAFSPSDGR